MLLLAFPHFALSFLASTLVSRREMQVDVQTAGTAGTLHTPNESRSRGQYTSTLSDPILFPTFSSRCRRKAFSKKRAENLQ